MPEPQQQTQQDPFASLYSASPPPAQAQPPAQTSDATPPPPPPSGYGPLADAALGMLHSAATHPAITGQDTPASAPASVPESSDDPFAHLYGSAASTRSASL